jgi:hypothetical protein
MPRLKTCQACSRHVFVHETVCPFCGRECGQETRAPIFDIKAGMSRAQRFAVVAAMAGQTALAGCNAADDPSGAGGTGGAVAGTGVGAAGSAGGGVQPVYGAPIAGSGQAGMTGGGGGVPTPVYGAPIEPDGGTAGSGGAAGAAGAGAAGSSGKGGGAQPVYGAPVPLYGASPPPSE